MSSFCPHCGSGAEPDNRFCGSCGGSLESAPNHSVSARQPATEPTAAPSEVGRAVDPDATQPIGRFIRRRLLLQLISGVIAVAGSVGVAAITLRVLGSDADASTTASENGASSTAATSEPAPEEAGGSSAPTATVSSSDNRPSKIAAGTSAVDPSREEVEPYRDLLVEAFSTDGDLTYDQAVCVVDAILPNAGVDQLRRMLEAQDETDLTEADHALLIEALWQCL